ncbi:MAG: sialate O-acetylesterase, partial [Ruminococcus sp.]|nr:sialate O-acetylesterase [Ruminococcus sp.]
VTVKDVLFGELFNISGQSNMELPLNRTYDPYEPPEFEKFAFVREFRPPVKCCFDENEPAGDFAGGEWLRADSDALPDMSAVGYYFAAELFKALNVPIGLLNNSAGGASVESFMSGKMIRGLNDDPLNEMLAKYAEGSFEEKTNSANGENECNRANKLNAKDKVKDHVFEDGYKFENVCNIPFYFRHDERLKGFCGRVWLGKKFMIPDDMPIVDAELCLGTLTDSDRTYLNGEKVGETGYLYPPRRYPVKAELLKHGENSVIVCMEVKNGNGGLKPNGEYCLKLGKNRIDLKGEWGYTAVESEYLQPGLFCPAQPLALYRYLAEPAEHIRVKAMLWYQGESNVFSAERYCRAFRDYIELRREKNGGKLPVIFAQLPNHRGMAGEDVGTGWAKLRAEQESCLSLPDTAMAVTIDCGDSYDLHPTNKAPVGRRLAYLALSMLYGKKAPENSRCVSAELKADGIELTFDGPALSLKNDPPACLEVCFNDGKTLAAEGKLTSEHTVLISMKSKTCPDCVRYCYSDDPERIDIYNVDGLPAAPFIIPVSGQRS